MARGSSPVSVTARQDNKIVFYTILLGIFIVIVILFLIFELIISIIQTIYSVIEKIIGKKNINIICAIFELVYVCLKWFCAICVFWYSKFHKNVIVPLVNFITPFFMAIWNVLLVPIWNVIKIPFVFTYNFFSELLS